MSAGQGHPAGRNEAPAGVLEKTRERLVAIVGPPNSGKSTLFNALTGLRQKVANFPGVTVEYRLGRVKVHRGQPVTVVDLPGIYSLDPVTEDERIATEVLNGKARGLRRPDAIVLVVDSTNLARHLMLAAPILALGLPTMVLLNFADELKRRGGSVNTQALARQLGAPVALVSAAEEEGLDPVLEFLSGEFAVPSPLELPVLQDLPRCRQWARRVGEQAGYKPPVPSAWSRRLDAVFLHPVWGPVTLVGIVISVVQAVFTWARPAMEVVQAGINVVANFTSRVLPEGFLSSLVFEGVLAGVGSVLVFLPQILILFLFIVILEDSGYMARAALITDRTMARVGLQGKSLIPLLSAHACAVPAILATRTIESRRDRIATILITPFITCSARLPVYTLIIAAFLPERPLLGPFLGTRAAALLGLYLLGYLAAFGTARLLKSSILKSDPAPLVLELPPYRWPRLRTIGLALWDRTQAFLYRAGTVILLMTLVLWAAAHLPLRDGQIPSLEESLAGTLGRTLEPAIEPLGFNWKIGVGLVSSLAARELIVSTLGTLYGIEGDPRNQNLHQALQKELTLGGAVALLVFFALAMQCISSLVTTYRETGSWRWPAFQFAYMGALAYVAAWAARLIVELVLA